MAKFNENNVNVACDFALRLHSFRRVMGNDRDTGDPYDYYKCEFRDSISDDSYNWNIPVIDGSRPPEPGQVYPLVCSFYKGRNNTLKSFVCIHPEYIS